MSTEEFESVEYWKRKALNERNDAKLQYGEKVLLEGKYRNLREKLINSTHEQRKVLAELGIDINKL